MALQRLRDPRLYQITVLALLLAIGVTRLDFEIPLARALVIVGVALGTQLVASRWKDQPFDPRSALISALSLCLLLRTESLSWAGVTAFVAIASKFTLRVRGKHLFNPTNFAIVAILLTAGKVWVSPGQWGNTTFFAFLFACLGSLVVTRAGRADISLGFAAAWGAILVGRALWLGQPMAIPLHQMTNGALLIFTFFMISDPRTTPGSRAGRLLFAALVAAGAAFVQFILYRPNGLLLSLAALSPVVPLLDRWLPGACFSWSQSRLHPPTSPLRSSAA